MGDSVCAQTPKPGDNRGGERSRVISRLLIIDAETVGTRCDLHGVGVQNCRSNCRQQADMATYIRDFVVKWMDTPTRRAVAVSSESVNAQDATLRIVLSQISKYFELDAFGTENISP